MKAVEDLSVAEWQQLQELETELRGIGTAKAWPSLTGQS